MCAAASRDSVTSLPSLRPASLRVNVAGLLRMALLEQRYQPGAELVDAELAKMLGVSRGPIREALIILAEEGLVEHRHHRGFRVPQFQASDLVQINQARFPLEVLSLQLARDRVTRKDLLGLERLKKALMEAREKSTPERWLTARPDFEFHERIWELSGNNWLLIGLRRICTSRFLYVSAQSLGFSASALPEFDRLHQHYIDYLAGSDALTAEECVSRHLVLQRSER